jgi:uncharacterized membrane protein
MASPVRRTPAVSSDNSRLIGLSDGVFAFALTLLVINLKLPDAADVGRVGLARAVLAQSNALLTWLLSFFVISLYWLAHHRIFDLLQGHDRRLTVLNLLFLLCISFIWYPTALLGAYGRQQFALVFYDSSLMLTSLVAMLVWQYAVHYPELVDGGSARTVSRELKTRTFGTIAVGLLSIGVSFVNITVAELCWLLLVVHRAGAAPLAKMTGQAAKQG